MNNYERIKAMSIEQMAKAFNRLNVDCTGNHCPARDICDKMCEVENLRDCEKPFKQWLESEAE